MTGPLVPATRAALIRDLIRDEGLVPHAYKCPAGKWTVGAGRNFEDLRFDLDELAYLERRRGPLGQTVREQVAALQRVPLSRTEAEWLLDRDIDRVIKDADAVFGEQWHRWSGGRQRAVLNMIYNLGVSRFRGFRNSIRLMQQEQWDAVATNILKSLWARQVGRRSERIAQLFRRG